jgi:hypothetical protein
MDCHSVSLYAMLWVALTHTLTHTHTHTDPRIKWYSHVFTRLFNNVESSTEIEVQKAVGVDRL